MTLTVIAQATNTRGDGRNTGNKRSRVRCNCGRIVVVRTSHIKSGKVTKCYVCLRADAKHCEETRVGIEEFDMNTVYIIEEGMKSPRDSSIGWRYWDEFEDKAAAIRQAKKLPIARVLESRQIYMTAGLEVVADLLPTRTPR